MVTFLKYVGNVRGEVSRHTYIRSEYDRYMIDVCNVYMDGEKHARMHAHITMAALLNRSE